jgi:RNA polymerase sigma factor (sigma-70 family)
VEAFMDDWQCLSEYVREGSQSAFREVVSRHVDLVYATCRRVLSARDAHLAEDATQAVFVILAKKARSIRRNTSLVGWLHNTARYVACNAMRVAANRRRHEMEAAQMPKNKRDAAASNDVAEDMVDRALSRLEAQERDAILLRFFEGRSFREVGAALSISEEAAKKRVWRGIEKLRQMLTPTGSAAPAAATIAGILTAAHQAPATLASAAAATALTGTGAAISLAKGAVIAMAISKTKATAAAVLIALLMGGAAVVVKEMVNRPTTVSYTVPAKPATQPVATSNGEQYILDTTPVVVGNKIIGEPTAVAQPCAHLAKNTNAANKTCTTCHNTPITANGTLFIAKKTNAAAITGDALVFLAGNQMANQLNVHQGAFLADATLALVGGNFGLNKGADAPSFDLPGFDGRPIRLADLKGKYVLLHFWSSQEKGTHEQFQHIRAAAKDWANEPKLIIIGINLDEQFSLAMSFAKEQQMTWINAYAGPNSKLLADYVTGAGNSVLIDPNGKIVDPSLVNLEIDDLLDKTLGLPPK